MRWLLALGGLALAGCGGGAPHEYPAEAKVRFERSCPPASAVCACTWERVTRELSYEEYEAALERFRVEGLMDPRITQARTYCLERHDT